ncbi:hypothetical protein COEREDRAFT_9861 [Coemansia reversa NRRL 1564]|uniref:Uncharacterized protein n=1 Tax=Coemansia reversa (strain ATCC 12441 / NRRL 1564) TaxID=763665 RepID=A0A2G5B7M3_COERN|nr:hypothetical protein COEREDRAFT_9861 [Coemansia reversa NRRL 1564]|eukprot:PIA15001.1 hypothetical protein COEREDRAFT_9861 [Coemansia reversa NRRL 1564]
MVESYQARVEFHESVGVKVGDLPTQISIADNYTTILEKVNGLLKQQSIDKLVSPSLQIASFAGGSRFPLAGFVTVGAMGLEPPAGAEEVLFRIYVNVPVQRNPGDCACIIL